MRDLFGKKVRADEIEISWYLDSNYVAGPNYYLYKLGGQRGHR